MKIIQINSVYETGSTGRTTKELHNHLLNNGIESWVFCTNYSDPSNNILKIGNIIDQKLHAFFSRLFGLQGYFSTKSTKKLINQIKSINPNIVHLRNLHSNYINFPILFKYLANNDISTVITLHDFWLITGHCCHFIKVQCYKWKMECFQCPLIHEYNKSWFFDRSNKIYHDKKNLLTSIKRLAVISNSEWTNLQVKESFLQNSFITEKIYNWVNLSLFKPFKVKNLERFSILGVAHGWSEKKGFSIFIEIARYFPEFDVILIGNINNKNNLILPKNLLCLGLISSQKDLSVWYNSADVFINPSLHETFGKVTAEALACGTPIIVNNYTANPEFVGENCGYIVEHDIQAYVNAIKLVRELGKNYYSSHCRKHAICNFQLETNIKKYIYLYNKIK